MPTRHTSAAREVEMLVLAGAPRDAAARAVAAIGEAERLADGALVLVLLRASRAGTDIADAAADLAAGQRLPSEPSDFELRCVAAEVDDLARDVDPTDVEATRERLVHDLPASPVGPIHMDPFGLTTSG